MRRSRTGRYVQASGYVAPGFEEVRFEFERNFVERGELGAAVSAYWRGDKVVDLWGGRRSPDSEAPWEEDTMTIVYSTTKGVAAMTVAVAVARGYLDYDAPIVSYWPEFGQNGKERITVRQLLGHEAGLAFMDEQLTLAHLRDLDRLASLLARQKPQWEPGTRHGYHAMSIGLYMQELIRRTDPKHRTLGRFFHEELAEPLELDLYIGLPRSIPESRLATMVPLTRLGALRAIRTAPPQYVARIVKPGSLLRKSMLFNPDWNDRSWLEVEVPAGNGVGTARSIARLYSVFAEGGAELGVGPDVFAQLIAPPEVGLGKDVVIGVPGYYSLGFLRPGPGGLAFGSSERSFGTPGAGGSFGFADPDARVGYAYVMNQTGYHLIDDPREISLRDAIYRAIGAESRREERVRTTVITETGAPQYAGP